MFVVFSNGHLTFHISNAARGLGRRDREEAERAQCNNGDNTYDIPFRNLLALANFQDAPSANIQDEQIFTFEPTPPVQPFPRPRESSLSDLESMAEDSDLNNPFNSVMGTYIYMFRPGMAPQNEQARYDTHE